MKFVLFLALAVLSISCTRVVYNVPQPSDGKALKTFPSEYQGVYVHSERQLDTLTITSTSATMVEVTTDNVTESDINSGERFSIKDGMLYDNENPERGGMLYSKSSDQYVYSFVSDRLVFGISDSFTIKQLDDYLVASFRTEPENYWDVAMLKMDGTDKVDLYVQASIRDPEDEPSAEYQAELSDFEKIVPLKKISEDDYLASPTPQQFREIIQKKLFRKSEGQYIRLK